jgi:prefoldin subunit 5
MNETKPNETKVDETKPSEMVVFEPKRGKVVGRSVAIALGILCIILAVGIVGAFAYYMPIVSDKDNTITTLNSQVSAKDSQISQLNSNITSLQNQNNQIQAWLDGNETLLNQTKTWLGNNITYYNSQVSSLNSQIANLQSQKNQLQTWLSGNITAATNYANDHSYTNELYQSLLNQIADLQNQISPLNAQISSLIDQVNDLTNTLNLGKSAIWIDNQPISEPANSYVDMNFAAYYAGYLSVWVQTSSSTTTYVRVIYSSNGVNYDNQITVGTSGTAVFPILPSGSIEVRVGNTSFMTGHTQTVTITFYY